MKYKVRNAAPSDIEEIIKLCKEHAEFEQLQYSTEGKAEQLAAYLFAKDPPLFCLIAEGQGGEILGYATYMPEFSTLNAEFFVHMDCLFLRPHARNCGIGEQLVKEIARSAKKIKCKEVQWQTPVFNERGIKFYRRIGATGKEKLRMYLDETTIEKLTR